MNYITTTSIIFSSYIVKVYPQMVNSLHDRWWGQVFLRKFFRKIHRLVNHLKQTLCCMHAWNDSSDQNSKTLKDVENLRKNDGCSQNGMENWKKCVGGWGLHHFLLTMIFWQPGNLNCCCKKRRKLWNTMEVNWFFLLGFFLHYYSSFSFDNDGITFFKEGVVEKKTILFATWILGIMLLQSIWGIVVVVVIVLKTNF